MAPEDDGQKERESEITHQQEPEEITVEPGDTTVVHKDVQNGCVKSEPVREKGRKLTHQQLGSEGITVLHKGVKYGCVKLAPEEVCTEDSFIPASNQEWYKHLGCWGSCLRLCELLEEDRKLIHQLGPEGITVLHKGVQHGCVKLVKYILVDMFDSDGNLKCTCRLAEHGKHDPCITREELVRKKSEYGSTAVNMAVVSGSPKMVLLLKWAIDKFSAENWVSLAKEQGVLNIGESDAPETDFDDMVSSWEREIGESGEGELAQTSANETGIDLEVPDVKDETIDKIYETECDSSNTRNNRSDTQRNLQKLIPKVYSLIEEIMKGGWSTSDQKTMDMLIDRCQKHVDFEFVPVPHVFLHFLVGIFAFRGKFPLRMEIVRKILEACLKESGEQMVVALFNILDPQGRTLLHVALVSPCWEIIDELVHIKDVVRGMDMLLMRECLEARDGAGRTILHLSCIFNSFMVKWLLEEMYLNVNEATIQLLPLCSEELYALRLWCFPLVNWDADFPFDNTPYYLAVLFNSIEPLRVLLPIEENFYWSTFLAPEGVHAIHSPLQIAAFLGRIEIQEHIIQHRKEFKFHIDRGLENASSLPLPIHDLPQLPIIHCAALSGQVEAIRNILKDRLYDPLIQNPIFGTALHLLLRRESFKKDLQRFHVTTLTHVLPNSEAYKRIESDFVKLQDDENVSKPFSANEISCINLLLQAGIDIWTPHCDTKELPNPRPATNEDARRWWYDRVVNEVVAVKKSISDAANATSVIAALVATASVIGPLQPPLGLSGVGGYVDTSQSAVQMYMVCNSLSFFFSIASILMAVLPAIPMAKESLYDEFLRSQRCLKGAALMLLVSIICLLFSFSAASLAVMSPMWRDRILVVVCIALGGGVCIVVLVIYIIRLLRMFLHKNSHFRRWFAEHMFF